jgi:hypothetical protein
LWLGICLIFLPTFAYLLGPIMLEAARKKAAAAPGVPTVTPPTLPPVMPQTQAQLRAIGYAAQSNKAAQKEAMATSAPAGPIGDVAEYYRQVGREAGTAPADTSNADEPAKQNP